MWFRVAGHLGMSVDEAQRRISSSEFARWISYYLREPFGPEADDVRSATLLCLTANVNRAPNSRPRKIEEFRLCKTPRKRMSADEVMALMKAYTHAHNAHGNQ